MSERVERSTASRVEISLAGDPQVIANILLKNQLLADGDPRAGQIKTALVCPGGGQRGVVQGGMAIGLRLAGVAQSFDHFVGVSSGAGCGYYTLVDEPEKGTEIYFRENVNNGFVNLFRPRNIMDLDGLEHVMRSEKPINLAKLCASRPKFWVGVTDAQTGKGQFFDAKSLEDPLQLVIASMCFPILSGKSVVIAERRYIDGGLANTLPISFAIKELGATDILVLMTSPVVPKRKYGLFHALIAGTLSGTLYRKFSPALREALASYETRYNQELGFLTGERELPPGVRVAAIYPSVMPINKLTMDSRLLQEGAIEAAQFTERLFSSQI